jgi:hypothetical protein
MRLPENPEPQAAALGEAVPAAALCDAIKPRPALG